MSLERCPWYVAGPLLGLVILGLRATLNKPFGALGGYIEATARPGFRTWMLMGLVLGGTAFALVSGSFAFSLASAGSAAQLGLLLAAGTVMGFGARTAGGCTSGHGMSGMSLGSPASIASTMVFFATAVALAQLMFRLGGRS